MQLKFRTTVSEVDGVNTFRLSINSITETQSASSRRFLLAQLEVDYSILVPASMFLPLLPRCDSLLSPSSSSSFFWKRVCAKID